VYGCPVGAAEIFFGSITRQANRRGAFTPWPTCSPSSRHSSAAGTNAATISWTKTADEILTKARGGQRTSFKHQFVDHDQVIAEEGTWRVGDVAGRLQVSAH
jgi:hypothetical protein